MVEQRSAQLGAAHVRGDEPVEDSRARAYGLEALRREAAIVAATGGGGRNNALNRGVFTIAGKSVSCFIHREEAFAEFYGAMVANGSMASRDPSDGPDAFKRSFESAWKAGLRKPLPGPRERYPDDGRVTINLREKVS